MRLPIQDFTFRQNMEANDFEFFYYKDNLPIEVDFHNHSFYEIYLFLSGNVTYVIEGKAYKLRPKDILIINNQEIHKAIIKDGVPYERVVIWINPTFMKNLCSEKSNLLSIFDASSNKLNLIRPAPDISEEIYRIAENLGIACVSSDFGNDLLKQAYFIELLVYLNRISKNPTHEKNISGVTYNDKISKIIDYINENLSKDMSLQALSSKFYLSKYHLLREFKKNTGYTIHRYTQQKRLIMARELLRENKQITEVCNLCGFGDYSNFIRAFKKEFGMSPKKYFKKN
ncbi:MAG: AraC family transcriptional regulator [Clostridiaceae bacterium]|jgi:AraC-like DNA-binding protein/mannose-6-phosphate isomerase-like protein (cupin superfamily)|nr:AraC family transcriptional regulator [Clostridiaceae bacterium]